MLLIVLMVHELAVGQCARRGEGLSKSVFAFHNKIAVVAQPASAWLYKTSMEPLIVIAIFLLGASTGSLITTIRYRHELDHVKAQLEQLQQALGQKGKEAA